jgi:hypothetical protein
VALSLEALTIVDAAEARQGWNAPNERFEARAIGDVKYLQVNCVFGAGQERLRLFEALDAHVDEDQSRARLRESDHRRATEARSSARDESYARESAQGSHRSR